MNNLVVCLQNFITVLKDFFVLQMDVLKTEINSVLNYSVTVLTLSTASYENQIYFKFNV
jgi:hypothetical protein